MFTGPSPSACKSCAFVLPSKANPCSACLFWLFSFGMTTSSVQFAILNTTSVENLSRTVKVYTLAVYMPRPPHPGNVPPFKTITYPLTTSGTENAPPSSASRTFAILHTKPGENPWDLGPLGNFKTVMGTNPFDWLFPLRYSPLCNHRNGESDFPLGPVVERLRAEAGIAMLREEEKPKRRKHRRSRGPSEHRDKHEISEKSGRRRDRREERDEGAEPVQKIELQDRVVQ